LVVGFNLPFDLSRLAIKSGNARRRFKNGFSLPISDKTFYPRIRIRTLDSARSFIGFSARERYEGRFLDLRTLCFALTNKKLSLAQACILFQTKHQKTKLEEYGKVNTESIEYNINDLHATYDLYLETTKRYDTYNLIASPERIYSPATIGKQYFKQMGIRTFQEQNPDFPSEILGYIVTTYYGGRSEIRIRRQPTRVRLMDFRSMYPTIFALMKLWDFLTAERIEYSDVTDEIQNLVGGASLAHLTNQELWPFLTVIVELEPNEDILPVRTHFGEKYVYNIGIECLTSNRPLWYTLPDVLASRVLTGKTPKIRRAIRFRPVGRQKQLNPIKIVGGSVVQPEKDLIKELIEQRRITQAEMNNCQPGTPEYDRLRTIQEQLKTVANSVSYGIFMEVNIEPLDNPMRVDAYGLTHLNPRVKKKETFGKFFHPIIATMLTSGARLMLAMAEAWLQQHNGEYAFCDTDSMAVSPAKALSLSKFFQPLNPYNSNDPLLKIEDINFKEGRLRELWFYGISAKRYVLFTYENGVPVPVDDGVDCGWSSHGLGHLELDNKKEWEKNLWKNMLAYEHGIISKEQVLQKYEGQYAVASYTITTAELYRRVKVLNRGKPLERQIKPYNFVQVGSPAMSDDKGEPIYPLTYFTKNHSQAPFQPFVDAHTGKLYGKDTHHYWNTLDKMVEDYIDHPESKFKNGDKTGKMRRRHLFVNKIVYIGKEANELEETEVFGVTEDSYVVYGKETFAH